MTLVHPALRDGTSGSFPRRWQRWRRPGTSGAASCTGPEPRARGRGVRQRWAGRQDRWPCWQADLRGWIPHLKSYFARHSQHRASALHVARQRRVTVVGNRSATVLTPSLARPGTRYHVTVRDQAGASVRSATADAQGCLTIPLTPGPGSPHQQYSPRAGTSSTGPSPDYVPFHTRGTPRKITQALHTHPGTGRGPARLSDSDGRHYRLAQR